MTCPAGGEVEYRQYPSSVDASLKLFANFVRPDRPSPLVVTTHGWHQTIKREELSYPHLQSLLGEYLLVEVNMRGRGECTGKPDANAWELQDVIDAVEFARTHYGENILDGQVYVYGASGGGGNVYGLVGKFPDYFAAAFAGCGMSDYALFYRDDDAGDFRDELDDWVGGPPSGLQEDYDSRSGLTTVGNVLTPLVVVHGTEDLSVPVEQARMYVEKARELKKTDVTYFELCGIEHGMNHIPEIVAQNRVRLTEHFSKHKSGRTIPRKGTFVVGGYLKTREFEVVLEEVGRVAQVAYSLEEGTFILDGCRGGSAWLRFEGKDY